MATAAILLADAPLEVHGEPAALLPWGDDETLVEWQVAQLRAAGVDVVVVVVGPEAERVIALVARDNVEPVVNGRWWESGAASLRIGAQATPRDTDAAIILRVEEPRPAAVHRALLDAHRQRRPAVTRPAFEGAPGAPVIVGRKALAAVRNLTDDALGLEAIFERYAGDTLTVPFGTDVVLLTIDGAEAYGRARREFGVGRS